MPLTIAIKTEDSRHIGFLLLAPNAVDTTTGIERGDCIFRSLPMRAEDFTHELAERLYGFQQRGEFEYGCHTTETLTSVEVVIDTNLQVRIALDASGQGSISEVPQDRPAFRIGLAVAV